MSNQIQEQLMSKPIITKQSSNIYSNVILDIVIPIFNALDCVKNLLNSLHPILNNAFFPIHLYMVDDASDKLTAEYLLQFKKMYKNITLLVNEHNLGYTKSLNKGIKSGVAPFVLQLNSDTIVTKNAIFTLLHEMQENERLFAVSPMSNAASWQSIPRVLDKNKRHEINNCLPDFSVAEMDLFCQAYSSGLAFTQLLNGFCVLYRRALLEQVGYADEVRFPIGYGEEDDLHLRAVGSGYQLAIASNSYVYHEKTQSFTTEQKEQYGKQGQSQLKKLHGKDRLTSLTQGLLNHPRLAKVRLASQSVLPIHQAPLKEYLMLNWQDSVNDREDNLVSIIMPVYVGAKLTENCIISLFKSLKQTNMCYELIVVLNGSDSETTDCVQKLQTQYGFTILKISNNLFFSMACNLGYMKSKGKNVLFVNNDMLFSSDKHNGQCWLEKIMNGLMLEGVGCSSIKLCYEDKRIQSAGWVWSKLSFFPMECYKNMNMKKLSGHAILDGVTGACLAITANRFAAVKGFDPIYINGSEDIDLCLKVRTLFDLKCYVDYDVYAIHLESKSPGRSKYIKHNRVYFYQTWAGSISKIARDYSNPIRSVSGIVKSGNYPSMLTMYSFKHC